MAADSVGLFCINANTAEDSKCSEKYFNRSTTQLG